MSVSSNIDPLLRGEAALALTNWRVVYGPGIQDYRYQLQDFLRACPFGFQAAVHLALIGGRDEPLPEGALASPDPDIAFTAELAAGDVDRLVVAAHDDDAMKRYAAAYRLIRMGHIDDVGDAIRRAGSFDQQRSLIDLVCIAKKSTAGLRDVFFELLQDSPDSQVRKRSASALCLYHLPGDTMRIAHAARGESQIYQRLMQTAEAEPEELAQLCEFMLERDEFRAEQWGMSDIVKPGRLPVDFVRRHWTTADEGTRKELCRVAEMQLEQYGDEELHRFLVGRAFEEESWEVLEQCWTSLYRWYERSDQGRMGPLLIKSEPLCRFFGSVEAFVPVLTRFLGERTPRRIIRESSNRQRIERFLHYAEDDIVPSLQRIPREASALADALHGVAKDPQCDFMIQQGAIDVLSILAAVEEVRPAVIRMLKRFRKTDLDLKSTEALRKIERATPEQSGSDFAS